MRQGNSAQEIGRLLRRRGWTVAVAESCTGGLVSDHITDVPGSSRYFLMSVVVYARETKVRLLRVPRQLIARHGAVSREVALAMARGVRRLAGSTIGLGITGIAGPTGGTRATPVGSVYIALAWPRRTVALAYRFRGGRRAVKEQASEAALVLLRELVRSH